MNQGVDVAGVLTCRDWDPTESSPGSELMDVCRTG
jgi:hypothetical protein